MQELERKVELVSLKEPWLDTMGRSGSRYWRSMGWVAQYESERRSERTKAGLERVRPNGKVLGPAAWGEGQAEASAIGILHEVRGMTTPPPHSRVFLLDAIPALFGLS